jgi:chloramphenicol-sensitive protein RarD
MGMNEQRRGYLYGLAAYMLWGFFPLYFKVLEPAGALEILAHRVIWSVVFVAALLTAIRRWRQVGALLRRPRMLAWIALAATLIAVNWGVYIYGVNSSHVVESSLGYFITPLISVAFGLAIFGERLRAPQWAALGLGAVAVAVLTIDYGRPPWIALTLAVSFSTYGLVKKRLALPPADGLFLESATLAGPGLVYLGWLTARGHGTFGHSAGHTALLLVAGLVTAVPLLLFASAANRIPLTGLGTLQYITPMLQLCCGVLIYHEPMPPAQLAGFGLVWIALAVFTWDALHNARGAARAAPARPSGGLVDQQPLAVGADQLDPVDLTGGERGVGVERRGILARLHRP